MKSLSEDRLNHLSFYMPVVIYSCLTTDNFPPTFISESVRRLMGYEPCEFINTPSFWADHIHPDEKEEIFKNLANLFIHDKHSHQYRFRLADGTYKWFQDDLRLIRNDAGEPIEIFGCMVDVSQQKFLESENQRIAIEKNSINERLRFIQDMHDGFGSQLAIAQLKLKDQMLSQDDLSQTISDCVADLHIVCDTLSEKNISLKDALVNFKYRLEKKLIGTHLDLDFDLDLDADSQPVSTPNILNILRILQEAVSNIIRHAHATKISISIENNKLSKTLAFSIKDNGKGINPNEGFGRGIHNMKSRALKLKTDLHVLNLNGKGTEVSFTLNI